MPNCTDQVVREGPEVTEDPKVTAGRVLAAVADHLTTVNPTFRMERCTRLVCIGAEAYQLADRSLFGDAPAMSRAALAESPEVPEGITRGEYALLLRKAAKACGYGGSGEGSQPAADARTEPGAVSD
ncbi:hypothetical protein PH213_20530 [Streptomyces sp. SRF1]|uniref:hypothetical protein n=1 Tax=Streptomyces sp. SRF1 TaxID=1549642 RepID=UPI0025AFC3B0|nr:hypothetical protein [Streptomyces sp. SRF1]MDN3056894.1 hypothetical protein [Streptomyces sp. SRF1]